MRIQSLATLMFIAAWGLSGSPAAAQTFNSGSTGADGAFSPATNTTLTLPATGIFKCAARQLMRRRPG